MSETIDQLTLLGGEWASGSDGGWTEDIDPADLRLTVARVPRLTEQQVGQAIDVAAQEAGRWAGASSIERGRVLFRAATLLRDRVGTIADDICREAGKLMSEARGEVLKTADFLEYYAGFGRMPRGEVLPDERAGTLTHTVVEPLGVVVLITAWNDPMLTPARKVAPALISGNTVVLKPAEDTPLAAIHLARALVDAGLPLSSLSVVLGHPRDVAEPLLRHPAVRAVSFTGSTATSHAIRESLAGRNIRFQGETGGKNAAAVLSDADIEMAAATITVGAFAQAGQRCTATSRVVADTSMVDELTEAIVAKASEIRVGAGYTEGSQMGPLISESRLGAVEAALDDGRRSGDSIVHGGTRTGGDGREHGCFLDPTVVRVAGESSSIWREELFAPVLAVHAVHGLDAAIANVNDSAYGLSAAVFTQDLGSAMEFARRVDTGQVAINRPTTGWDVHLPFGGFKESGSLSKEQGAPGLDFYTKMKTIAIGY